MGRRKRLVFILLLLVPLLILTSALEQVGWDVARVFSGVAAQGPREAASTTSWP